MTQTILPWGFHTWHAIHYIALGYPDAPSQGDMDLYYNFFKNLGYVLPCKLCTGHYNSNFDTLPPDLTSRDAFFAWSVALHNVVNKSLGKREWTTEEAKTYYLTLKSPLLSQGNSGKSTPFAGSSLSIFVLIALVIVLLIIIFFLVRHRILGGKA